MIQILEGKGVGSGKSYQVCEFLLHHFRQGGSAFVSDSFEIKWENLKALVRKRWGLHLEDDQFRAVKGADIFRLNEVTSGGTDDCPVLIVVDEAQDHLNARDWADKSKRELFAWACQSRHDNNDLLFVTQASANIDKQIRRIATYTWSVRNLNTFPIPGLGKVGGLLRALSFGMFHGIVFSRTLLDYDGRTQLERKFVAADKDIFNCYVSKSMRSKRKRLGEPIEKKALKRDESKKLLWRIIFPVAAAILIFGIYRMATHGIMPKMPGVGVPISKKVESVVSNTTVSKSAPQAAYSVVRDRLLYRDRSHVKTVTHGMFQVNEMSSLGLVMLIRGNMVKIQSPDGAPVYVIAEDWSIPAPSPSSSSSTVKQPPPVPIIAKDSVLEEYRKRMESGKP